MGQEESEEPPAHEERSQGDTDDTPKARIPDCTNAPESAAVKAVVRRMWPQNIFLAFKYFSKMMSSY